jgi:hypothetical protein
MVYAGMKNHPFMKSASGKTSEELGDEYAKALIKAIGGDIVSEMTDQKYIPPHRLRNVAVTQDVVVMGHGVQEPKLGVKLNLYSKMARSCERLVAQKAGDKAFAAGLMSMGRGKVLETKTDVKRADASVTLMNKLAFIDMLKDFGAPDEVISILLTHSWCVGTTKYHSYRTPHGLDSGSPLTSIFHTVNLSLCDLIGHCASIRAMFAHEANLTITDSSPVEYVQRVIHDLSQCRPIINEVEAKNYADVKVNNVGDPFLTSMYAVTEIGVTSFRSSDDGADVVPKRLADVPLYMEFRMGGLRACGFAMEVEYGDCGTFSILSQYPWPCDSGIVFGPDIFRRMVKSSATVAGVAKFHPEQYTRDVCMSGLRDCGHVPFLRTWFNQILKNCDKKGKKRAEENVHSMHCEVQHKGNKNTLDMLTVRYGLTTEDEKTFGQDFKKTFKSNKSNVFNFPHPTLTVLRETVKTTTVATEDSDASLVPWLWHISNREQLTQFA